MSYEQCTLLPQIMTVTDRFAKYLVNFILSSVKRKLVLQNYFGIKFKTRSVYYYFTAIKIIFQLELQGCR